jgi:lincosamide nucleotidyltransferase A/C/D/E
VGDHGPVVLDIVETLEALGVDPRVTGGWGIDALAGRQTRDHRDLDLAVRAEAVDASVDALVIKGYR